MERPPYTHPNQWCEKHECFRPDGWCWECAEEQHGYDGAKRLHAQLQEIEDLEFDKD